MAQSLHDLYAQYGYLVHRRCVALLGDRADAEDAMHEVFLRAERYGRKDQSGSTLAWLYAIATRCCFDLSRRRARTEFMSHEQLARVDVRREGSERDGDVRALVGRALRELDVSTCRIGVLHHVGGLTQEEVAEETGFSRKTIGKRLQAFGDAMARWREELP
jgi:RNA polymerase sigma factor (sigma-70 family)